MLDRVKADHAAGDGLSDTGQHVLEAEHLQQPQDLDKLALAAFRPSPAALPPMDCRSDLSCSGEHGVNRS